MVTSSHGDDFCILSCWRREAPTVFFSRFMRHVRRSPLKKILSLCGSDGSACSIFPPRNRGGIGCRVNDQDRALPKWNADRIIALGGSAACVHARARCTACASPALRESYDALFIICLYLMCAAFGAVLCRANFPGWLSY